MTPHRQARQADVSVSEQVDVQRVPVQTDVFQVLPDEVAIVAVTEGVHVKRLDVVVLIGERSSLPLLSFNLMVKLQRWRAARTCRCNTRRLSGRGVGM